MSINDGSCDYCEIAPCPGDHVYDAPTKDGPWACMCEQCYPEKARFPGSLGEGLGQKFRVDVKLTKVEG